MEKRLSEEHTETLIGFGDSAERLKGTKREFGSFRAEVAEDNCIVVTALSGWKMTYPPMSTSWVYLLTWMTNWEECKTMMETFVKLMVYPVANRLEGMDAEYVRNIVDAQLELDQRIRESMPEPTEEERAHDLEMAEKVVDAFAFLNDNK